MSRPLLITDCDEVLLHMVSHFGDWLAQAHDIDFQVAGADFSNAMTRRATGATVERDAVWPLLDEFFIGEMGRQTLVPGAREAIAALRARADVVVLTNLMDHHNAARVEQLRALGIEERVVTNQGGKGRPVAALIDEYAPTVTVFVDDLPQHHESVSRHAPGVFRLHMVAEPAIASAMPPAPHAHARIDDWPTAQDWIAARFEGETIGSIYPA